MDVYYYCSYTKSPVGFRLGKIDAEKADGSICELSSEHINSFIWKCFSTSAVRKACGQIPQETEESSQYFLLLKSRQPVIIDGIEYFINFALVTGEKEEYERWFQSAAQDEAAVLQAIRTTMVLNGASEFGFLVRPGKIRLLTKQSYRKLFEEISPSAEGTYLETASAQTGQAQLLDMLGLTEYDVRRLGQGNWVYIKKKQQLRTAWIIAAIAAAAVVALLLLLNCVGRNSEVGLEKMEQEVHESMQATTKFLNSFDETYAHAAPYELKGEKVVSMVDNEIPICRSISNVSESCAFGGEDGMIGDYRSDRRVVRAGSSPV